MDACRSLITRNTVMDPLDDIDMTSYYVRIQLMHTVVRLIRAVGIALHRVSRKKDAAPRKAENEPYAV